MAENKKKDFELTKDNQVRRLKQAQMQRKVKMQKRRLKRVRSWSKFFIVLLIMAACYGIYNLPQWRLAPTAFDKSSNSALEIINNRIVPAHKILTGRREGFEQLRTYGGMSGFPKRKESNCDAFDTGHSSTSISAGLGLVRARDIKGEKYTVVSVIGDGALTGGMAYEALNNAANLKSNYIIVLNDNNMSISENVGGMSMYLDGIRTADFYNNLKKGVVNTLQKIPGVGEHMVSGIRKTKNK